MMLSACTPDRLAAMLRGTPVAPTLTAPPPEPTRALPRALAAWQAEQARRKADQERAEAEALARATTPMQAWTDGKLHALKAPTVANAAREAQEATTRTDHAAGKAHVPPIAPNASQPAPQDHAPKA